MNKQEIIAKLQELQIPFDAASSKKDLEALLPGGPGVVNTDQPTTDKKMYSEDEVQAMIEHLTKTKGASVDKPKKDNSKEVRIARYRGKFVVGFKNQNEDPYFPDKVVHAYNQFNEKLRQFEAWVEVIYMDGSTERVPLLALVNDSSPVVAKLLNHKKIDTSYSIGETTRKVYKDTGGREDTGIAVDQTVTQHKSEFEVKLPTGEVITVPEYVINIA